MRRLLTAFALSAAAAGTAQAATVYTSLAAWQAALTGGAQVQDFSAYPAGTNLSGVDVLPGVSLSSNLGNVQAFHSASEQIAMAFGARTNGDAYYDIHYSQGYLAAAFDIIGYESIDGNPNTAVDQGLLTFFFGDGSTESLWLPGGSGAPIFIGIVSGVAITSIRWAEAHEASGGNEETGLDNLRVAMPTAVDNELPLPGTLPLALLALGALPVVRRRR